jgi:hypothetical protein
MPRSQTRDVEHPGLCRLRLGGGVFELAAGGVDIAAAGAADVGGDAAGDEAFLKGVDSGGVGLGVGGVGAGVPDDEVDVGGEAGGFDQGDDFVGVGGLVVDAAEQDVLESDFFAGAEGDGADGVEDGSGVPFAGDGHDGFADLVVRGVEGDGETRAFGLLCEALDAGHDARGGDGHTRGLELDGAGEQAEGSDPGVVVEEWLAHAHEDEVDAVAAEMDTLALEHGDDLTGNFAGGQVTDDAEFSREAEVAVDGAADLGGDANGGAALRGAGAASVGRFIEGQGGFFRLSFRVRQVSAGFRGGFGTVAAGHPDGFDGLAVEPGDEVALGAIDGGEGFLDLRQTDGVTRGEEIVTEGFGERGHLVDGADPLAVERVLELLGAVARGTEAGGELGELDGFEAEQRQRSRYMGGSVRQAGGAAGGVVSRGFGSAIGSVFGCTFGCTFGGDYNRKEPALRRR